jgi:hypothetical protein
VHSIEMLAEGAHPPPETWEAPPEWGGPPLVHR